MGNTFGQTIDDWNRDIQLAKAAHIDGFALNAGPNDSFGVAQLALAYQAAEANGFKMFISFDMVSGLQARMRSSKRPEYLHLIALLWNVACFTSCGFHQRTQR